MKPSTAWGDVLAAYCASPSAPLVRETLELAERRSGEAFAVLLEAELDLAACREFRTDSRILPTAGELP